MLQYSAELYSRLVRPHNTAGLFIIVTVLGTGSIILLPIGLELACEVTRNADGSSAILWFLCVLSTTSIIIW